MGALSHLNLQQALYTSLTGDSTLMAAVTGVYDRVTEGAVFPYITLGDIFSRDWATTTSNGLQLSIMLHIWSRSSGRKQTLMIMERVHALLHHSGLSISGQQLIMMRFGSSEVTLERDGITYHGMISFNA